MNPSLDRRTSQERLSPHIRAYLVVFGVLMFLTVVTVLVSYLHLPKAPAILVGLAIATVKAGLVGAFFMHLKGERALIYALLAMTAAFMVVLFLLPFLDTQQIAGVQIPHPWGELHSGPDSEAGSHSAAAHAP